jgi:DNA-binding MarR family transcriptional regulator
MQKQHLNSFLTYQKLLDVKELTTYEKLLYVALTVSADGKTECEPSVKTLARLCSCSPHQVTWVLNSLQEKGHITRVAQFSEAENNAQMTNRYILHFSDE